MDRRTSLPAHLSRSVPLHRLLKDDVDEGPSSSGPLNDPLDVRAHPGNLQLDVLGATSDAEDPGPGSKNGLSGGGPSRSLSLVSRIRPASACSTIQNVVVEVLAAWSGEADRM